jgi:hypothetical protein
MSVLIKPFITCMGRWRPELSMCVSTARGDLYSFIDPSTNRCVIGSDETFMILGTVSLMCTGGVEVKVCIHCSLHASRKDIRRGHTPRGLEIYQ